LVGRNSSQSRGRGREKSGLSWGLHREVQPLLLRLTSGRLRRRIPARRIRIFAAPQNGRLATTGGESGHFDPPTGSPASAAIGRVRSPAHLPALLSGRQVESFRGQICTDAILLISSHLPNKLMELDNLLRADLFNVSDLSLVHAELDIPIPDPPKNEEEDEGKEKKKEKPPKCGLQKPNEKIVALVQRVKPELRSLKEACILLTTWITYLIPKIEDGNDFGVAVQEKILERIGAIKTKVEGFQTAITKYFTERGDAVAKASKDTHVMDYRQLVHEKDEAAYLDIRTMIMDVRGYYIELLDLITKNAEKVTSPKGEEKSYSMY
ncbi:proteasome activator complex subunit 2, partial [Pristis pectinata]|uniref:proteasome activator complex subunit 2 n=1 Tax=Pristis pectinata TaxID=685728 RepID=UPI00223E1FE3